MRTFLAIAILSLFVFTKTSNAQFEQFSWMLNGASSLWFSSGPEKLKKDGTKTDNGSLMNLYLRTGPGIFVLEQMAVGLYLNTVFNMSRYKYDNGDVEKYSTLNFAFGPFVRYYIWQMSRLLVYSEFLVAFGVYSNIYKYPGESSKTKEGLLQMHLLAGINYFIAQNIALDFGIGYLFNRYNYKDGGNIYLQHQFMACLGITLFLCRNAGLRDYNSYK